MNGTIL